jgi:hypothetical protein
LVCGQAGLASKHSGRICAGPLCTALLWLPPYNSRGHPCCSSAGTLQQGAPATHPTARAPEYGALRQGAPAAYSTARALEYRGTPSGSAHSLLDRWSPLLAKEGTLSVKRPSNLAGKRIDFHVSPQGSLSCRKSMTRDKLLYFPSEGRRAGDFYARKNPTASAGFEPPIMGTRGQHANP